MSDDRQGIPTDLESLQDEVRLLRALVHDLVVAFNDHYHPFPEGEVSEFGRSRNDTDPITKWQRIVEEG